MRLRLSLLLLALSCASVLIGARQMEWRQLFSMSGDAWLTLTASRLPRLAALVLTGVGLSVCGVILQHIVRNRFVEPGTWRTGRRQARHPGVADAGAGRRRRQPHAVRAGLLLRGQHGLCRHHPPHQVP